MDYEKCLEEGGDVVEAGRDRPAIAFRDREIDAALAALTRKRSLLLVGPPGAGKSAVVDAVARHLKKKTGATIRRLTTTQILAGTRYIGDWQTTLTRLMTEAEK
jgi:MoxR-like ATPase